MRCARRSDAVEGLAEDLFARDIVSGGWVLVPMDEVDDGGASIRRMIFARGRSARYFVDVGLRDGFCVPGSFV